MEDECPANREDKSDIFSSSVFRQGAEARLYRTSFFGRPAIAKQRFRKKYRHPTLDEKITLRRLHGEARSIVKARRLGVRTPVLYAVDAPDATLLFEFVQGPSVKELLLLTPPSSTGISENLEQVAVLIGQAIAKLHDGGLIHGDLTTSNMLLRNSPSSSPPPPSSSTLPFPGSAAISSSASSHTNTPTLETSDPGSTRPPGEGQTSKAASLTGSAHASESGRGEGGPSVASPGVETGMGGQPSRPSVCANEKSNEDAKEDADEKVNEDMNGNGTGSRSGGYGGALRKGGGEGGMRQELVLIDFGLSQNSTLPEDKAVDLYVLERAILALHSAHEGMMDAILTAYRRSSKYWSATLNKLAQVRLRGRKRVMVG